MNIFDDYVKEYDEWYDKNKYVYLSEVEALKQVIPKEGKGLEIGVGTGRFAQTLGVSVGIDPSKKMLELAKGRGIKTFTGKGEYLPFFGQEFDYVLIAITICFVSKPEQVIEEAKRVLKDNGKIIIGIVDRASRLGKFYLEKKKQGHRFYKEANFFSTLEILQLIRKHGFKNIVVYQTIFEPLDKINKVEQPKRGFEEGGFIAICGTKMNEILQGHV